MRQLDGLPRFQVANAGNEQDRLTLGNAQLLGQTRLRVWGFQIYDARLWVAPGFRAQRFDQHGAALELTYLRAFASADIAARSITEMRRSADISASQAAQWQQDMQRVFPDIKAGDRLFKSIFVSCVAIKAFYRDRWRGRFNFCLRRVFR